MNNLEIMRARHSVRRYQNKPIELEKITLLRQAMEAGNRESGLSIQLFIEEPEAFQANKTHYGMIRGCRNYLALVGPKGSEERLGYYGEKLVLLAQSLGLNTCWVGLTYQKGKVAVDPAAGEKLHGVIALGYGENQGTAHKSKPLSAVADIAPDTPKWFLDGMEAVVLAPTAVNQQKFYFRLVNGNTVSAKPGFGFYTAMDLGIAKYHFELGAGTENFRWE